MTATPGQADPWQVITDVMTELLRGGQTAVIRCGSALKVLERAGIDFDGKPVAAAAQEPHAAPELAEQLRLVQADLADAEAEIGRWPRCPSGCRCRVGTSDADALECGCDGPCTTGWEPQPAPGFAAWLADQGDALGDGAYTAFDMAAAYGAGQDDPLTVQPADDVKPAPELAAAMRESRGYREALEQVAKHTHDADTQVRIIAKIAKRALEGK